MENKKSLWDVFEEKLRKHDKFYMFSDDYSVYKKGLNEYKEIKEMANDLSKIDSERVNQKIAEYLGEWVV